jgi:hypothetical protein
MLTESHPDRPETGSRKPRLAWWERLCLAFVIEHELADGSRVSMPIDLTGMLVTWPLFEPSIAARPMIDEEWHPSIP